MLIRMNDEVAGANEIEHVKQCEMCRTTMPDLSCQHCQAVFCLACAIARHRTGSLKSHSLHIITHDHARNGALPTSLGGPCSFCETRPSFRFCPLCSMVFCESCLTSFHAIGASQSHVSNFIDKIELDSATSKPYASPISTDSQLQQIDVITIKIYGFGIAVTSGRLENMATKSINCFLTLNCEAQVLRLYCKGEEPQQYEFSRPFDDLLNATANVDNPCLVTIQFKSFSMTADVLMMRDAESKQVAQLVYQIRKRQCAFPINSIETLPSEVTTFKGFAQKRGKMTWSLRYLVVSGHVLYVFRDDRCEQPLNSIDLLGSPAFKTASKQLTIGGTEREFVFRLKTKMQTDVLNAVLQHCHGAIEWLLGNLGDSSNSSCLCRTLISATTSMLCLL
uniref:B box-type domain-containing protein n=1 Tax=Spongospora subterranea TaxID=70186 RepID=A0A0H5RB56_9EUKA|eukprot:CRZ11430.1 hypothetical protein [Spongospora subterranea]